MIMYWNTGVQQKRKILKMNKNEDEWSKWVENDQ